MFCPTCGAEERQMSQFCRACGTNLQPVRGLLEPANSGVSAVSARDEIGRAIAERIREIESTRDLKRIAERVLPQIEKFLESPEERRLRRIRAGVISGLIGLAVTLLPVFSIGDNELQMLMLVGGVITAVVGFGLLCNGLLFSRPHRSPEALSTRTGLSTSIDAGYAPPQIQSAPDRPEAFRPGTTANLAGIPGSSVTEPTTNLLNREG